MEREILFRGKPMFRESNDFVYGYYKQGDIAGVKTDFILPLPEYKNEINEVAVCPLTVGQYTGLTDKNGVKIFEGDILKRGSHKYVVKWCDDCAMFVLPCITDKKLESDFTIFYGYDFEIIGNAHDNPELLKGDAKCANISE